MNDSGLANDAQFANRKLLGDPNGVRFGENIYGPLISSPLTYGLNAIYRDANYKIANTPLPRRAKQAIAAAADGLTFGSEEASTPFDRMFRAIWYNPEDLSSSVTNGRLYQGASFLMSPNEQAEWMKKAGYPKVDDGDYGLVNQAVQKNIERTNNHPSIYEWAGSDPVDPANLERITWLMRHTDDKSSMMLFKNQNGNYTLIPDFPDSRESQIDLEE